MSELMMGTHERKLWFDGPNHTADAVILDPHTDKILLIRRGDTGEWALPGGFIDIDEPAILAAQREAAEEAGITLGDGQLVYQGIVDDPRNSEKSWIETSAYVFLASSKQGVSGNDDAIDAEWQPLDALPPLYASHRDIVGHAFKWLSNSTSVPNFENLNL